MKKVYTTKEVGDFCGVDLTTVINWVKQDKLEAFKTAGGHRRIKRNDLKEFMMRYSMPFPAELRSSEVLKILVVDDDPNILTLIAHALKKLPMDYKMVTAADGFEAGNKLATFKPNIVILDIRLLGIDGCTVIEKIRSNGSNEKILAITAYGDNESKEKVLVAGANRYLAKPFSIDEFLIAITSLGLDI